MSRSFVLSLLQRSYGAETTSQIVAGFGVARRSSFRRNPLKISSVELKSQMKHLEFAVTPVIGMSDVYQFEREHEYAFKGSRLFREGLVYLQSLSSMLSPVILAPTTGSRVLDICAAPGSKTTQIAAIMNNTGSIIALEKSPVRADILRHNIALQGVTNTTIVRQEASSYLAGLIPASFKYILLDAPCSGMGRLASDREEPWKYIDPANLQRRSDLQKHLIARSLPLLAPGGSLVYSTCTLGDEENSDVIKAVLHETTEYTIIPPDLSNIGAAIMVSEQ